MLKIQKRSCVTSDVLADAELLVITLEKTIKKVFVTGLAVNKIREVILPEHITIAENYSTQTSIALNGVSSADELIDELLKIMDEETGTNIFTVM